MLTTCSTLPVGLPTNPFGATRFDSVYGRVARRNLKISEEAYQRHSERKEHYGLTWDEYLDAGCPEIPDE